MPNQQLITYIKQQLEQGKEKEEIKQELLQAGWSEEAINEVLAELGLIKKEATWSIVNLFEKTWQRYTSRLGVFVLIKLISLAVVFFVLLVPFLFVLWEIPVFTAATFTAATLIALFVFFIPLFFGWWTDVSLLEAIKEEEKIGVKEALRRGWRKFLPYAWIRIINFFIKLGLALLFVAVLGLLIYFVISSASAFLMVLAIPLLITFFIVGTIFRTWFSLTGPVFVVEGKKGLAAFYRSRQLVSGRWWGVFLRLFLVDLAIVIISLFIFGISFILSFFIPIIAENLHNIVSALLITPFVFTFTFFIYKDLFSLKTEIPFEAPSGFFRAFLIFLVVLGIVLPLAGLFLFFSFLLEPILSELGRDFQMPENIEFPELPAPPSLIRFLEASVISSPVRDVLNFFR